MANHHFGKFADVWKHLVLAEVLFAEKPTHYGESHAGSAVNMMLDDSERDFGVRRFLRVGRTGDLATSRYRVILEELGNATAWYPGSAALAMTELDEGCQYLFCDQDPISAHDLRAWIRETGIDNAQVLESDGISGTMAWLRQLDEHARALVHVDPFDPDVHGDNGKSAIELARDVAESGHALVYWYGYDAPEASWWPYRALDGVSVDWLWCGDMMVLDADGETCQRRGHLGLATTPGTGCGVLLANVSAEARSACERLGRALQAAYAGALLPDGTAGQLRFTHHGQDPSG